MVHIVGHYELGRTLGEGTFAKVKLAKDTNTQTLYAMKVFSRSEMTGELLAKIKDEVSILKHVRHPNVANLHEVLASKTHVYIVLELVTGGELFDRIATSGKLEERHARAYFQQLIDAVAYCHERGVCHRDLKPENLLLDASGRLKISDFGLSCLPESKGRSMGALKTTCGTPNYVAPEVLRGQGYDGRSADVWSCGCILYVLVAGFLPFDEPQLAQLFLVINAAKFKMPDHFSPQLKDLISRILTVGTRATIEDIRAHPWFVVDYVPVAAPSSDSIFSGEDNEFVEVDVVRGGDGETDGELLERPAPLTAFDLIGGSPGLDLSAMFDRGVEAPSRAPTRFPSMSPPNDILAAVQAAALSLGFHCPQGASRNFKLRMEGVSRRGPLVAQAQVFEMCPGLHLVEVRKVRGDAGEFSAFFRKLEHHAAVVAVTLQGG